MRLALAWAACPTFLLGDFDSVKRHGREGEDLGVALVENRLRVPNLIQGFLCEGLSEEDCKQVPQPDVAWTDPATTPPSKAKGRTYTYDAAGTDKFWKQYLKQTYLAHAAQTAFEHMEMGCMSKKCIPQLKACHGAQPCNRRLLRMETNKTDNGIDAVYGTEGPAPYNRSEPLMWADLSDEEHGVFSCALASCAEPRLAVVDALAEDQLAGAAPAADTSQRLFVKRLFDEDEDTAEKLRARYHEIGSLGCQGLVPILDTDAKVRADGKVFGEAVVMPNMDGTARGWAKRHSLAERQECAPALMSAVTQGVGCLHKYGLVHDDLIDVNVLYTETDPAVLLEDSATLRR